MSGKFLARASALSLAVFLAACGGDENSTPIVNVNSGQDETTTGGGTSTPGETDTGTTVPDGNDTGGNTGDEESVTETPSYRIGALSNFADPSSTFTESVIFTANPNINVDGAAQLRVVLMEPDVNELVLGSENSVTFFSACSSSDWSSFAPATVNAETGIAGTLYTPSVNCIGQDVIYARINDDFSNIAKLTVTNSGVAPTPAYKVGSIDESGVFQEDRIRAENTALTIGPDEVSSTKLRLAITDLDGALMQNTGLAVKFVSMCVNAGLATIDSNGDIDSGQLIATYSASPECIVTDTVTAFVGDNNQLSATVELSVSESGLAIGSYANDGRFIRNLTTDNKTLGYQSEEDQITEVRSAVAKVDSTGNFLSALVGFESNIQFFSTCIDSGLATITSGSTQSGELISSYVAEGCVGTDILYGRIAGTNEIASTPIEIAPKVEQVLFLGRFDAGGFTDGEIGKSRATALPVGAQTRLYLSLVDKVDQTTPLIGQPLSVQLSSTCEGVNGSDTPFAATNLSLSSGYAEVLYTAQTCGLLNEDTVTATLTGTDGLSATAQTPITLDKNGVAHSLTASQPVPNSIAPGEYDGTYEGRTSTSLVQFHLKNKDGTGTNLANKTVSFRLDDPAVSGITLTPATAQTDEEGFVTVTVKGENGAPNSVFRVIATHEGLETYSAPIAVNSKLPVQSNFSLSTTNLAPDSWGKDGVTVELSLRAADNEGNRLRGNTVVNFKTGGLGQGTINPDCVLDSEGRCIVAWESLGTNAKFAEITAYTHGLRADGSTGEISSGTRMLMSLSEGLQVQLLPAQTPYNGGEVCARVWTTSPADGTEIMPPAGTTLEFAVEPENGVFIPESSTSQTVAVSGRTIQNSGFLGCTFFEPKAPFVNAMTMTVVATTPEQEGFSNNTTSDRLAVEPPPPAP